MKRPIFLHTGLRVCGHSFFASCNIVCARFEFGERLYFDNALMIDRHFEAIKLLFTWMKEGCRTKYKSDLEVYKCPIVRNNKKSCSPFSLVVANLTNYEM